MQQGGGHDRLRGRSWRDVPRGLQMCCAHRVSGDASGPVVTSQCLGVLLGKSLVTTFGGPELSPVVIQKQGGCE